MTRHDLLRALRFEIEADLEHLKAFAAELMQARTRMSGQPEQRDLAHVGYLLHGMYTGWESAFKRIATAFENNLDPAQWHSQLLERMSLDIPGVRPAAIDQTAREHLERLRSFRHFFRQNYFVKLRARAIEEQLEEYDVAAPRVEKGLRQFLVAVEEMANELDKPQ